MNKRIIRPILSYANETQVKTTYQNKKENENIASVTLRDRNPNETIRRCQIQDVVGCCGLDKGKKHGTSTSPSRKKKKILFINTRTIRMTRWRPL
jgi:hypothetical protein